jgi:hypothetical protein
VVASQEELCSMELVLIKTRKKKVTSFSPYNRPLMPREGAEV